MGVIKATVGDMPKIEDKTWDDVVKTIVVIVVFGTVVFVFWVLRRLVRCCWPDRYNTLYLCSNISFVKNCKLIEHPRDGLNYW